ATEYEWLGAPALRRPGHGLLTFRLPAHVRTWPASSFRSGATRFSIRSVLIVVLQPMHDAVLFLSAERREIEQVVGIEERIQTALVGRVGVEHSGPVAKEHAQAFPLAFVRPALGLPAKLSATYEQAGHPSSSQSGGRPNMK